MAPDGEADIGETGIGGKGIPPMVWTAALIVVGIVALWVMIA
ncbi:hypothetical protein [Zavarzinia sp.]